MYFVSINNIKGRPLTQIVYFNPFSSATDFRRQILTSNINPRAERVKYF